MKILDLDMDYFLDTVETDVSDFCTERLSEKRFGDKVWSEIRVRNFLETNLGLSKDKKVKGCIVSGHNEALFFWKKLINRKKLIVPFDVIHVDSHADLGVGYSSWKHIYETVLSYPVHERPMHCKHSNTQGIVMSEGIGDYLLFAVAYQWISSIIYCANPYGDKNDYYPFTLKDYKENLVWNKPVNNIIQLTYNPCIDVPQYDTPDNLKKLFFDTGVREPEVPLRVIPTIEDVKFSGDFDYAILAQSPNYTPASADFIIDVFKEYIDEC